MVKKKGWVRYYHATDERNLGSILDSGLRTNFGELYCSTNRETCLRWVSFSRMWAKKIVVFSFDRKEGDSRMSIGCDHSPIMTAMLGVEDKGASIVSNEPISPKDFNFDDIIVYDNPFYNEEYAKQYEKMMKHNRKILEKMEEE